jgi:puromycin-sensitive aminopeptidase
VPLVLRVDGRERRVLLRSGTETVDTGGKVGWVLGNAGARGFYRSAYEPDLLRRLVSALPELRPEERMALVSDQWALLRADAVKVDAFLQLLAGLRSEEDHTVLDEVVGRLAWLEHRGVDDADRPRLQAWVASLFAPAGAELGWDAARGDDDERRLRRAAVLRALALVARDPGAVAEAAQRFRQHLVDSRALDPNLLDIVVAAAAREADEDRFRQLREHAANELDPAAKRRYLHALATVEKPALIDRAVDLALDPFVQMQDFASYLGTLLANRAAREAAWRLVQTRWEEVRRKGDSPMLLRRLVEALGSLPERSHLVQVEKFLSERELSPARQAVAQTLERLRADVALRERLLPEVKAFLQQAQ